MLTAVGIWSLMKAILTKKPLMESRRLIRQTRYEDEIFAPNHSYASNIGPNFQHVSRTRVSLSFYVKKKLPLKDSLHQCI